MQNGPFQNHIKLIYKCLQNQACQVLNDFTVPLRVSGSVTHGAPNGNCKVPLSKSSFGQTAFSVQGIKMWHALPAEL